MMIKQLSVFMENRQGRLGDVLGILKEKNVNVQSLSLADTAEYGLLRLIVDQAEEAKEALLQAGFSAMLTDVIAVKIPHQPGSLQKLVQTLAQEEINVEYMYGLTVSGGEALVVVKTSDIEKARAVFQEKE